MATNPTILFSPGSTQPFDLGNALNWSDAVTHKPRLPNSGDTVVFNNSYSITNNLSANYVYGNGDRLVSGTITANRVAGVNADTGGGISAKVLLGGGASNGGTISAQTAYSVNAQAGGTITAGTIIDSTSAVLDVVANGAGALVKSNSIVQNQTTSQGSIIISNGGAVNTGNISAVGTVGASNGISIRASGAGSNLTASSMAFASLYLSNGATATVGPATHKRFEIDGAGSLLQYGGGNLQLGGAETLRVSNYATQSLGAVIADAPSGQNQAYIGVSNHAILSLQSLTVGNGLVDVTSAGTITTQSATLPGQVSLSGTNSSLIVTGTATIGPALFGIFQGATLSTNDVTIQGLMEVAGNGGLLKITGGAGVIGDTSRGQVNVYSGATLSAASASGLLLGNAAASYGNITLDGSRYFPNKAGSASAVMTANNPNIGVMGRGFINVRANSDLQVSGLLQLGLDDGGSGSLSIAAGSKFTDTGPGIKLGVNGTNSSGGLSISTSFSFAGYIEDGRAGSGSVFIYGSSANVSVGSVVVGELSGSNGSFHVAGKGATATIAGGTGVKIGDGGQGSLIANNGGRLTITGSNADVILGAQSSASGSLYVDGAASMLQVGGRLSVAGTSAMGQGTVAVTNGGTLDVTGGLSIGKKGTLTIQGTAQGTTTSVSSLSVASPATLTGGTIKVAQNGFMKIGGNSAQAADQFQIGSGASVVGYGMITSTATGKASGGNGASTWSLTMTNAGTIEAKGGTSLTINADLTSTNTGEILIDPDSTLELGGKVGPDTVITFQSDGSGQLVLDDPADFQGTIAGMKLDDQIILKNTTAEGGENIATLSDATVGLLDGYPNLQLLENGNPVYLKLDIPDITTTLSSKGVADQFFNVALTDAGGSDTVLQLEDGNPLNLSVNADKVSSLTGAGIRVGIISSGPEITAMEDMVKAIAPDVVFVTYDVGPDRSSENVATGIFFLANQQCNVIVDDVTSGDEVLDTFGIGLADPAAIAITQVQQRGVTYVTAVGNNEGKLTTPAFGHEAAPSAIKVAALNWLATPAGTAAVGGYIVPPQTEVFSRQGPIDLTGPDAGPSSTTFNTGNLDPFFGTSAAAPVVAGIAALMMEKNPQLKRSPGRVKSILTSTTTGLSLPAFQAGSGLADANNAVAAAGGANPFYTDLQPALSVASAILSQDGGNIGTGTMVQFQVTMNDAVTVTGGTPALILSDGAFAIYDAAASQPRQAVLVFDYTVASDDRATNLALSGLSLNGAMVRDDAGNDADFTGVFNVPTGVSVNSPLGVGGVAASQNGELQTGQTARLNLTMNQPVTVVIGGVAPTLTLNNGATAAYDPGSSNPGGGLLTFAYTVGASDLPVPNLSVFDVTLPHGTTVRDSVGNNADFSAALNQGTGLQIGPAFAQGVLTSPTTNAGAGDLVQLTLVMSGPVSVNTGGGSPTLTLNDGATATFDAAASNPAAGALVFDYTVGNETTALLVVSAVNLNGATVLDGAGVTALIPATPNFPTQLAINIANDIIGFYQQILGRTPSAAEVSGWQTILENGTTLAQVRHAFATSGEAQNDITGFYQQILGRTPSAAEVSGWQTILENGTTLAQVRHAFATSGEAQNDITGFYQQILGRTPSAAEVSGWQTILENGTTLAQVRHAFATSGEAQNDITGFYQQILGRTPSAAEVSGWQTILENGTTLAQVRHAFATSGEAQNDITGFYQQILGRTPNAAEVSGWQTILENGTTLAQVRHAFATSGEAQNDIIGFYQQILGRTPSAAEVSGWQTILENGTTLAQVRHAFATSGEAQNDITGFYQAILNRTPSPSEVGGWETILENGTTLAQVRHAFATSGEAQNDITGFYQAILNRTPSPSEVGGWETVLENGTPLSQVRSVFATSPEAQNDLSAIFQSIEHRAPDQAELAGLENQITVAGATQNSVKMALVNNGPTGFTIIVPPSGSVSVDALAGPERFDFSSGNFGNDTVVGFNDVQDAIELNHTLAANFSVIQADTHSANGSTLIAFNAGQSITLNGINPNSLVAPNFHFV